MSWIVGIDEVGRGPLAGPVAVGAFAIPSIDLYEHLSGIRDSKKMSERARLQWCGKLTSLSSCKHAVFFEDANIIDTFGITHAIRSAIKKTLIILNLNPTECSVLLDGSLYAPEEYIHQKTIIRGDETELVISAASILAKVERDDYMKKSAKKYPLYFFDEHKGYGTRKHIDSIKKYGLCGLHRKSFCKNIPHPDSA